MIFIYLLSIAYTSIESGSVVLRESHKALKEQENVGDCAEDSVGRFKVRSWMGKFGVEDDGETGIEADGREGIDYEVDSRPLAFLVESVGWLKY
jgi:hypothetical protein